MIGLLIYVCMSALGLTLIKMGVSRETSLLLSASGMELKINWMMIIGLGIYILSFLMSIIVMKKMNLSVFYPLSAGLVYILICLLSVLALHEKVSLQQMIGMAVIFAGIIIMNIGRT